MPTPVLAGVARSALDAAPVPFAFAPILVIILLAVVAVVVVIFLLRFLRRDR